jgi:hypothetical protein
MGSPRPSDAANHSTTFIDLPGSGVEALVSMGRTGEISESAIGRMDSFQRAIHQAGAEERAGARSFVAQVEALSQPGWRVVSRAHFNTFLVTATAPRYHIYLIVEWTYDQGMTSLLGTAIRVIHSAPVDRLPAAMKATLHRSHQSYIA